MPTDDPHQTLEERRQAPAILYVDVFPYRIDPTSGAPRFLALQRCDSVELADSWQPVCGKLKAGERISHGFVRQVVDKTGQTPARLWSLTALNTFYDAYYDAVLMVPAAACELASADITLRAKYHRHHRWLSADEAKDHFVWPNQRACIDEVVVALARGLDVAPYRFRQIRVTP